MDRRYVKINSAEKLMKTSINEYSISWRIDTILICLNDFLNVTSTSYEIKNIK